MKYVYAILACFGLLVVYTTFSAMMGWKHGGGAIPMLMFFAALSFIWKKIVKKDKDLPNKSTESDES